MTAEAHPPATLREHLARVLHDANTGRITPDNNDPTLYGRMADAVLASSAFTSMRKQLTYHQEQVATGERHLQEIEDIVHLAGHRGSGRVADQVAAALRTQRAEIEKLQAAVTGPGRSGDPAPRPPMEHSIVEAVARALWHDHAMQYADVPLEDWSRVEESYREGYLREARVAIAAMPKGQRYWVGYYCPRGSGHYEIYGQPEYTPECGSKGWNLYLDAEEGDEYLPEGEWQ